MILRSYAGACARSLRARLNARISDMRASAPAGISFARRRQYPSTLPLLSSRLRMALCYALYAQLLRAARAIAARAWRCATLARRSASRQQSSAISVSMASK